MVISFLKKILGGVWPIIPSYDLNIYNAMAWQMNSEAWNLRSPSHLVLAKTSFFVRFWISI